METPRLPTQRAELTVNVYVTYPADSVGVLAYLFPGTDTSGQERPLIDSTLRVGAMALLPDTIVQPGLRLYRRQSTLAAIQTPEPWITLHTPSVDGFPAFGPFFVPTLILRHPDTVDVRRGDDYPITLGVISVPGSGAVLSQYWMLSFFQDPHRINLNGSGAPPESLVISAALFQSMHPGIVTASFEHDVSIYRQHPPEPAPPDQESYGARIRVATGSTWAIRLTDPPLSHSLRRRAP